MKGYNGRKRDLHFDRELYKYLERFDDDECEYEEDDENESEKE